MASDIQLIYKKEKNILKCTYVFILIFKKILNKEKCKIKLKKKIIMLCNV